jgi:hypothetical protein
MLPGMIFDYPISKSRWAAAKGAAGKAAYKDAAANWLLTHGYKSFQPVSKKFLDTQLDLLRASGAKLDTRRLERGLRQMDDVTWSHIERELPHIGNGLTGEFPSAGDRAKVILGQIRSGAQVPSVDLAWLIHLRSQAKKSFNMNRSFETQDAMDNLASLIDDVIREGKFRPGSPIPESFQELQRHYARTADADDFAEWMLRRNIVSLSPGLTTWTFNLKKLVEDLRTPGSDKLAQTAQRVLLRPGNEKALLQLEEFVEKMSGKGMELRKAVDEGKLTLDRKRKWRGIINIETGPLARIQEGEAGFLSMMFTKLLVGAGPSARERFMRIVLNKRGWFSAEDFMSLGANTARRGVTELNDYLQSVAQEKIQETQEFLQKKWEGIKNWPTYPSLDSTIRHLKEEEAPR